MNARLYEAEVALPANPYGAAAMYLSALAYPDKGAGQPGGAGLAFSAALLGYLRFLYRKKHGLAAMRAAGMETVEFREVQGRLDRGLARVNQRMFVRELEAFRLLGRSPSFRRAISPSLPYWSRRLRLYLSRRSDDSDDEETIDNLRREAYSPSLPVLHMAQVLYGVVMPWRTDFPALGSNGLIIAALRRPAWADTAPERCAASAEHLRLVSPHLARVNFIDVTRARPTPSPKTCE